MRCLQDLVAIGYGQFEYVKHDGGLLCCWSLKNPEVSKTTTTTTTTTTNTTTATGAVMASVFNFYMLSLHKLNKRSK